MDFGNVTVEPIDLGKDYISIEMQTSKNPPTTLDARLEQPDFLTVVKALQALSGEIILGRLIEKLLVMTLEQAGAQRGLLIILHNGEAMIEAEAASLRGKVEVRTAGTKVTPELLPMSIFNLSLRTRNR